MKKITSLYEELNESQIKRYNNGEPYIEVSKDGISVIEPDWDHLLSLSKEDQTKYSKMLSDLRDSLYKKKPTAAKNTVYDVTYDDFKKNVTGSFNDIVLYGMYISAYEKNSKLYTSISSKAQKSYDTIKSRIK